MLDFDSESDTVVLDLPAADSLVDGWKILPLTPPQVLIGASLSEPHTGQTTSPMIYVCMYCTSFHK